MPLNTRAIAARILVDIFDNKRTLTSALETKQLKNLSPQDRGFVQELCYGVMRWHWQLDAIIKILLSKPLKIKDNDIHTLLLIGIYQLHHLKTPPHAAVNETAQAAREIKKIWAVGLINGVLRQWQRDEIKILSQIEKNPVAFYSHPEWLLQSLKNAWPQHWKNILIENNQHPPMTLRVNLLKKSREKYLQQLEKNNISARAASHTLAGIILDDPQNVNNLPGFNEGDVSVQDAAAQLAAELLKPTGRVLDACAAPGGKTAHLLESAPDIEKLIAIDVDKNRLKKVAENFNRLGFDFAENAESSKKIILLAADATQPQQWWDGKLFDCILLDAPCSATGVIRRHPDIKFLREEKDIAALSELQLKLLEGLWPLLKPGGILLYVTCSVLPQENNEVLKKFLENHSDAREKIIESEWGISTHPGKQILPDSEMDGFFYGRLEKSL